MKKIGVVILSIFVLINIGYSQAPLYSNVLVSDVGASNTIGQANTSRNIAVDNVGNIYVVYSGSAGIRVSKSTNRGQSFSPSVLVSETNFIETEIAVSDNGTVHVAWSASSSVFISSSYDGGLSFSVPKNIGAGQTPHIATHNNSVYVLPRTGNPLYRNHTNGNGDFVTTALSNYAYSDVFVDKTNGDVYVLFDDPNVYMRRSTDGGISFVNIPLSPGIQIFYSSYAMSLGSDGKYIFVGGDGTNGRRINMLTGATNAIGLMSNANSQGRTLVADEFGNFVDGYFNGGVNFRISYNQGATWQSPILVSAAANSHNISRNPLYQDVVVVYSQGGAIYCNTYGSILPGIIVTQTPMPAEITYNTNPSPMGPALGKVGGFKIVYESANWPLCLNWGLSKIQQVVNLDNNNPPETDCSFNNLVFDQFNSETDLENGKLCFTGVSSYYCRDNNGNNVLKSCNVRMRVIVTEDDDSTPVELDEVGIYLLMIANKDFNVRVFIEANADNLDNLSWIGTDYHALGGWHGVVDIYDNLQTDPFRSLCTQFNPDSFYSVSSSVVATSNSPVGLGGTIELNGSTTLNCCYNWVGPNNFSSTNQNPQITNAQPESFGTYELFISDNVVCYGSDNVFVMADEYVWTGNSGNDWNDNANWNVGVPPINADARIPGGLSNYPMLDENPILQNLNLANGANLVIGPQSLIKIEDNIENNGLVYLVSSALGDGAIITENISGTGVFKVERFLSANNWHLVSSPITNALAGVFVDIWLRPYNEATNTFGEYIIPITTPMPTGQGFAVWAFDNDENRIFSGTVNNGLIGPLDLSLTGLPSVGTGWNLIGNPFPCVIDWNAPQGWTKTNTGSTIYIWNGSQYATWNGAVGVNGGTQYIAMGQGFFVQASDAGSQISMDNRVKTDNTVAFMKNQSILEGISLSVTGNGFTDEHKIVLNPDALDSYDHSFDAAKLYGVIQAPQLYTYKEDAITSIHSLSDISLLLGKDIYLELGGESTYTLNYTSSLVSVDAPLIYDKVLNLVISPNSEYTFSGSPLDINDRFTFINDITDINIDNPTRIENELVIYEASNILFTIIPEGEYLESINIYSINGSLVLKSSSLETDMSVLSSAVYIVKVQTDKQVKTAKVLVR